MDKPKKHILRTPCREPWESMQPDSCGKFCTQCQTKVYDLTKKSLLEIEKDYLGSGKCVRLTDEQVDYIKFKQPIKKIAFAASLFFGSIVINVAQGQTAPIQVIESKQDSCLVKGKVIVNRKSLYNNEKVYYTIGEKTYETITNNKGVFKIYLPKNSSIDHTNVGGVYEIKDQNVIKLGKVHVTRRVMGFI